MELNGALYPHPTPTSGSFTLRETSVIEEAGYDPQPVGTLCVTEKYLYIFLLQGSEDRFFGH